MKRCRGCGRYYMPQKDDKMCMECKRIHEFTFLKLKNNKALHEVMRHLADR